MSKSKTHMILALSLTLAGVAPAMAGWNGTESMLHNERARAAQLNLQQSAWVSAQVKSANVSARKITVSHAAIKSIGMPAMTMTFAVADEMQLESLKKGDQVEIQVSNLAGVAKVVDLRTQR